MKVTVTIECLFLFHLETMVKAYEDQMIELGLMAHVYNPSSWKWRHKDSQCEARLRDRESTNRHTNHRGSHTWWGRGGRKKEMERDETERGTQRTSNERVE